MLQANFNEALEQLQQAMQGVIRSADAIGTGAGEIATASEDLSQHRTARPRPSNRPPPRSAKSLRSSSKAAEAPSRRARWSRRPRPTRRRAATSCAARSTRWARSSKSSRRNRQDHRRDRRNRVPDQPACAQCRRRGGAGGRSGPRLRRRRLRSARARAALRGSRQGDQGPRHRVGPGGRGGRPTCRGNRRNAVAHRASRRCKSTSWSTTSRPAPRSSQTACARSIRWSTRWIRPRSKMRPWPSRRPPRARRSRTKSQRLSELVSQFDIGNAEGESRGAYRGATSRRRCAGRSIRSFASNVFRRRLRRSSPLFSQRGARRGQPTARRGRASPTSDAAGPFSAAATRNWRINRASLLICRTANGWPRSIPRPSPRSAASPGPSG